MKAWTLQSFVRQIIDLVARTRTSQVSGRRLVGRQRGPRVKS